MRPVYMGLVAVLACCGMAWAELPSGTPMPFGPPKKPKPVRQARQEAPAEVTKTEPKKPEPAPAARDDSAILEALLKEVQNLRQELQGMKAREETGGKGRMQDTGNYDAMMDAVDRGGRDVLLTGVGKVQVHTDGALTVFVAPASDLKVSAALTPSSLIVRERGARKYYFLPSAAVKMEP